MLFLAKRYVKKVKMLSPRVYAFSKIAVTWRDLTNPRKSPKFELQQLRKTFMGFRMSVLTAKSDILFCL